MKKITQMNQLTPSKVQNFSGDQKVAIKAYFHFLKNQKVPSAKSKPRGPRIGKGKTLTTNHLLKKVGKLRSSTRSNNLCKQMLSKRAQKKRNAAWLRECNVRSVSGLRNYWVCAIFVHYFSPSLSLSPNVSISSIISNSNSPNRLFSLLLNKITPPQGTSLSLSPACWSLPIYK